MLRRRGYQAAKPTLDPLVRPCDLGLVEGVQLDAAAAAAGVEASQQVAGDVLAAPRTVSRVDLLEVLLRRAALSVEPGLDRTVGDRQSRCPCGGTGVVGLGEVAQAGDEATLGSDGRGDAVGEVVELAGDGLVSLDTAGTELAEVVCALRNFALLPRLSPRRPVRPPGQRC